MFNIIMKIYESVTAVILKKMIFGLLLIVSASACNSSKRLYNKGFHIEWRNGGIQSSKVTVNKKAAAQIASKESVGKQSIPKPSLITLKNEHAIIPMVINGKSAPQIIDAEISQLETISKKKLPALRNNFLPLIQSYSSQKPRSGASNSNYQSSNGSGTMVLAILSLVFAIVAFILFMSSDFFMYGTATVSLVLAIFALGRYDRHERGIGLAVITLMISLGLIIAWWKIIGDMF